MVRNLMVMFASSGLVSVNSGIRPFLYATQ